VPKSPGKTGRKGAIGRQFIQTSIALDILKLDAARPDLDCAAAVYVGSGNFLPSWAAD
jgi:hypothetical protein